MSVKSNISSRIIQAKSASLLAKNGEFEELQLLYPKSILYANDEHKLLMVMGGRSQSHLPTSIMYMLNYAIAYDEKELCFHVLKNRSGKIGSITTLIYTLTGIQLHQTNSTVLTFVSEEDAIIAKLKGFLCLPRTSHSN